MSGPRVICRVQAMYPYQSGDSSALSFGKGDIIEVLTQLESGWWDGWCNGLRGWFPSNYVVIIEDEPEMIAGDFGSQQSNKMYDDHENQWFDESGFQQYSESVQQQPQFREISARSKEQLRLSLASSDRSYTATPTKSRSRTNTTERYESPSIRNGLPPNWIKQTTEDGTSFYYYNVVTHKMRYTHPDEGEEDEESMGDLSDDNEPNFQVYDHQQQPDNSALHQHAIEAHGHESDISQDEDLSDRELEPRIPPRSANRIKMTEKFVDDRSMASSGNRSRLSSVSSQGTQNKYLRGMEDQEQYPPNWTKKLTPQGRPYYCNMLTNETTWNIEDVDPSTGELLIQPGTPTQATIASATEMATANVSNDHESKRSSEHSHISHRKAMDQQAGEPLNWGKLSSLIAHAIHDLNSAARNGSRHLYKDLTTAVVESIRLMLYASNSIDKENSPHLKNDKTLRAQYRAIMAALSKLVLSAKLASTMWSPPDAVVKMETDANDVLVAVRNYLGSAQEAGIEVQDNDPRLVENGATSISSLQWRRKRSNSQNTSRGLDLLEEAQPRFVLHPDQVSILQNSATGMHSAIISFIDNVRKISEKPSNSKDMSTNTSIQSATPLIIAQFRNLGNIISQFLNHVEDIAVDSSLAHAGDLKYAKQCLYNSMGALFVATQFVTNDSPSPDELDANVAQVEQCATTVEESVWDICRAMSKLTAEKMSKAPADIQPPAPSPAAQRASQRSPTNGHQIRDANDLLAWKIPETSLTIDTGRDTSQDFFSHDDDGRISPDTDVSGRDELDDILASPEDDLAQPLSQRSMSESNLNRRPDDKLKKFFGEDAAAAAKRRETTIGPPSNMSAMPSTIGAPSTLGANGDVPWYLGYDYTTNDIVFNMEGQVKGGTLTALVERLTLHDFLDSKFINTFLLTYRSFCTTDEWFDLLVQRYNLLPPQGLSSEEIEIWNDKKQKLVRLRVFNVIKTWLENFYNEEEDQHIISRIMEFAEVTIRESMQFAAEQLIKLVKKRMDTDDNSQFRKMILTLGSTAPPPILPKNMKRIRLLDVDPLEIARQLTVMDSRLYIKIKPVECLDKNWGKEDSENMAANVKASIEYSNQITAWVTDSILSQTEIKKRCAIIKHWVQVAEKCRILNNFNTCMAILSAFDNSAIGRLKRTWDSVSARTMQTLAYIRKLMGANKNFTEYREIIHSVNPPCIPFLGIYLQDLTFIEDGNTNFLRKSNQLINFAKRMKTAEVIREIQQYQSSPYVLNAVPELQLFITTHLQSSRDEETCYNLSLALEPREREDEKIARLLKESGFS
ncbi:hypothetical protein INT43_002433 [Umbelopsis isabellina]|uniref:Ras GEF n=1 Tax=Mortierella isabellina TaxID=91625 RepID=A0A8H7Q5M3_MORIS|nr:hypothetical protein INT43_002433 [Umbelopsis isabellina]